MDPTGGATPVEVASINKFTIDFGRDNEDVTCFGDVNKVYVLGLPNVEGDIEGVWDETTSPEFLRIALGDVPVTLKLIPSTNAPTYFFTGQAYLSTALDCPADGAVTLSGSFVQKHKDDILHLVRHLGAQEQEEHPLHRLMNIAEHPESVVITTTDIHLPHRIGHALHDSFQGELDYHYEEETYFIRVDWKREK